MIGASLFAGPGGLDLAAELNNVRAVGIEWDANAVATRVAAGLATIHGDVTQYGPADIPGQVLTGGPPCQTFTHRPYRKNVPQHEGDPGLLPWVSMGEALDRPQPFTVISNYGTGGDPKNRGRRTSAEPAFTVTGKISRNRIENAAGKNLDRFTHAEAGVLQGFPADYPWSGADIPQQVGNSCPIPLGVALMKAAIA